MNMQFNILTVVLFSSIFSTWCFADKGWRFFAGMEKDFVHETSISLTADALWPYYQEIGSLGMAYGVELSFNSPLLQPSSNKIRQQFSYLQYKNDSSTIQTFEINPHYVVEIGPKFWLGGGPGIGFIRADVNKIRSNLLALQIGASAHYSIAKLFAGAEVRYQFTENNEVGGTGYAVGVSNWQALFKLGYNFY